MIAVSLAKLSEDLAHCRTRTVFWPDLIGLILDFQKVYY